MGGGLIPELCHILHCFNRVHPTLANSVLEAYVLQGAAKEVPSLNMNRGFFSCYFLVLKKDGILRPILNLRHLIYVQNADAKSYSGSLV